MNDNNIIVQTFRNLSKINDDIIIELSKKYIIQNKLEQSDKFGDEYKI